jgi:hypothetical protein
VLLWCTLAVLIAAWLSLFGYTVWRLRDQAIGEGLVHASTHAHMPTAPARPVDLRMPSSELCTQQYK